MAEAGDEIRFVIGQNSYYVNGVEKAIDVAPCIRDGRTYLPLRAAANAVGIADSDIGWNAEARTVTLKKGATMLVFTVGSTVMRVDQTPTMMDVPAQMIEGRVMLPIRWLAQALECETTWDANTQSVGIKPLKASGEPSVKELLASGSAYYLNKDYQNAALMYQKALDMEKKQRQLSQDEWRVLVDNLAMAYGISGNLEKSKETLEYGISQEPTYPNFYYSLACAYAESGDMQKAIDNLKLAFKYKDNNIKGETFPDPRTDSSFAKFMQNEEFKKALDEMMK